MFRLDLPCPLVRSRASFFADTACGRRLAIGTGTMSDRPEQAVATLHSAWSHGFLLTDTSPRYPEAENLVGQALRTWKGDEPVLATKCGMELDSDVADFHADALSARHERSCQRLGRGIDYLAVHEPDMCPREQVDACLSFVTGLLDRGDIRALGLGGGGPGAQQLWLAHTDRISYVIVHNRLSAVTVQAMTDSIPLCRQQRASVWLGSPLMMGMLGDKLPYYRKHIDAAENHEVRAFVERAAAIERLATEAGMTLPHLALRFALSLPCVDTVISGAVTVPQWTQVMAAYHAGPLEQDLFARIWTAAQRGPEPYYGG